MDESAGQSSARGYGGLIAALSLSLFLLHMLFNRRYGYFVDELYYLACSHHLAWGYVDQPPLIALITWLERVSLGDSLHALRFLPAVAAGGKVLLTGLIARELGARRFAIVLASVAVIVAPFYLGIDNLLTMNAFEPLFWMGCALIALKIFHGANPRLWLAFGLLAGIGLQNKHSMLFFGFALVVGMLLGGERRHFAQPWIWFGGAIALLIFLPNLLWEIHRNFPTIELLRSVQLSGRNTALGWLGFILTQIAILHPLSAPIWIAGLVSLFRDPERRGHRVLAWTYVTILLCMLLFHGRIYYMAPAYPMLFAAGGVAFENWIERRRWNSLKPAYIAVLLVTGAIFAPFAYFPLLTVDQYIAYSKFMHLAPPKIENHEQGPLPQIYADQFGWQEMAQTVAAAYFQLPPEERRDCAIFGQNYGQAGAIDFFGAKLDLPNAISGHQSYFYWGPRGYSGRCMIVLDDSYETLSTLFESVEKVGHVTHPLSMPYQHFDVFLCRRPRAAFSSLDRPGPASSTGISSVADRVREVPRRGTIYRAPTSSSRQVARMEHRQMSARGVLLRLPCQFPSRMLSWHVPVCTKFLVGARYIVPLQQHSGRLDGQGRHRSLRPALRRVQGDSSQRIRVAPGGIYPGPARSPASVSCGRTCSAGLEAGICKERIE